jgi:hypothetical protein
LAAASLGAGASRAAARWTARRVKVQRPQVPTTFRLLGYPGLAILFFFAAAAGGLALVASIVITDGKEPRPRQTGS